VQLKSLNGVNAGASAFYKYSSNKIEGVVWTLGADGFYTSQLIEIAVAQSDLDTYTSFVVIMQAYNKNGLKADTITPSVQTVHKAGYIDVKALKSRVDTMQVPANMLNTLEIPFRGYSAMTPVKVKKDGGQVDAITAATISSRAFCDGVMRAYDTFEKLEKEQNK